MVDGVLCSVSECVCVCVFTSERRKIYIFHVLLQNVRERIYKHNQENSHRL